MDTLIGNGDFALSQNGIPIAISGLPELVQRAKICLCVKKGSFLYDESLGSRFFELTESTATAKDALALLMAQESLKNQPLIRAYSAQVQYAQDGSPNAVRVMLMIYNTREEVTVNL